MAHFRFDEERHRYVLMPGSRAVPSVTQVLDAVGMSPDLAFLPAFYRQRGRAIHRAMALQLLGRLDHSTLDPRIEAFIQNGCEWLELLEITPLVVEHRWCHTVMEYGGTLDLFCESRIGPLLIDWKSTMMDPSYEIQVAGGYEPLLLEAAEQGAVPVAPGDVRAARIAVVTLDSNPPKMHWCSRHRAGASNADVFRAALTVAKWRQAHKR